MVKNKFYFSKKGQFYILSVLFLSLLLIFIYSSGTQNTYIVKSTKFNLVENIMYETCQIGYMSNGTYIDQRYDDFETFVFDYCDSFGMNCTLIIENNTVLPLNLSLVNYTLYDYRIEYQNSNYIINEDFMC